jgi:hypothetical protein
MQSHEPSSSFRVPHCSSQKTDAEFANSVFSLPHPARVKIPADNRAASQKALIFIIIF